MRSAFVTRTAAKAAKLPARDGQPAAGPPTPEDLEYSPRPPADLLALQRLIRQGRTPAAKEAPGAGAAVQRDQSQGNTTPPAPEQAVAPPAPEAEGPTEFAALQLPTVAELQTAAPGDGPFANAAVDKFIKALLAVAANKDLLVPDGVNQRDFLRKRRIAFNIANLGPLSRAKLLAQYKQVIRDPEYLKAQGSKPALQLAWLRAVFNLFTFTEYAQGKTDEEYQQKVYPSIKERSVPVEQEATLAGKPYTQSPGPKVTKLLISFLDELWNLTEKNPASTVSFRVVNYGAGEHLSGYAADLYLAAKGAKEKSSADPDTGFYKPGDVVEFVSHIREAAAKANIVFSLYYNDATVAPKVNTKGNLDLKPKLNEADNFHGPIKLHLHIDIAPKR